MNSCSQEFSLARQDSCSQESCLALLLINKHQHDHNNFLRFWSLDTYFVARPSETDGVCEVWRHMNDWKHLFYLVCVHVLKANCQYYWVGILYYERAFYKHNYRNVWDSRVHSTMPCSCRCAHAKVAKDVKLVKTHRVDWWAHCTQQVKICHRSTLWTRSQRLLRLERSNRHDR